MPTFACDRAYVRFTDPLATYACELGKGDYDAAVWTRDTYEGKREWLTFIADPVRCEKQ